MAVAVAVLSIGGWLASSALRKPPPEVPDAGPPPVAVVATPSLDAGAPAPIPDAGGAHALVRPPRAPAPADPCIAARARFEKLQGDCHDPCDLDHYPMREDLDRCRACDAARAELERCRGAKQ
jgi:hypothetical protein